MSESKGSHLSGKSEKSRLEIARRVGELLSSNDLSETDFQASVSLAQELVVDVIERVRRAFSVCVRTSTVLPKKLAMKIAQDVESVSVPFLNATDIFNDKDWELIIASVSRSALLAIANRKSISQHLAILLVEKHVDELAKVLIKNPHVAMDKPVSRSLVNVHGDDSTILDLMAERDDLDGGIVVQIFSRVSHHAREKLTETYKVPNYTLPLVNEAEMCVVIDLLKDGDPADLLTSVQHLRRLKKLTDVFLLNVLARNALVLFDVSLSVLTQMPLEEIEIIVRYSGAEDFERLLFKAKIRPASHDDFWLALQKVRSHL